MNYRKLKSTPLEVSEISFGCMSLDPLSGESDRLLNLAAEQGINYFDTADLYQDGENERMVGRAFDGKRQEVIIATKVGNQRNTHGEGWSWNPSKAYILQAIDESLKRLRTDYIDLYQLHGGTIDDPTDETIEAFELLKAAGKIRHYGISSIRPNVIRRWVDKSSMVSNMMQYSLLDRRPEESALSLLQDHGVGVMVRGAVARGLLAGKPSVDYLGYTSSTIDQLISVMSDMPGRRLSEIAVQYVLHHQAVSSVVLGIRTKEQLDDALAIAEAERLSASEMTRLRGAVPVHRYEQHR